MKTYIGLFLETRNGDFEFIAIDDGKTSSSQYVKSYFSISDNGKFRIGKPISRMHGSVKVILPKAFN